MEELRRARQASTIKGEQYLRARDVSLMCLYMLCRDNQNTLFIWQMPYFWRFAIFPAIFLPYFPCLGLWKKYKRGVPLLFLTRRNLKKGKIIRGDQRKKDLFWGKISPKNWSKFEKNSQFWTVCHIFAIFFGPFAIFSTSRDEHLALRGNSPLSYGPAYRY